MHGHLAARLPAGHGSGARARVDSRLIRSGGSGGRGGGLSAGGRGKRSMTAASAPARFAAAAQACPSCAMPDVKIFYRVDGAPVHSVLLMNSPEMARGFPKRSIALGLCRTCGFISNTEFDSSVHSYSGEYEETQGYSATFRAFHEKLARDLIGRYGIRDKTVIEVGCGKGEFLSLLCRLGNNRGIGIDPAFVPARNPAPGCDVEF